MNAPSEQIKHLVRREFKQPFIWDRLTKINQSVISLEIQNEELKRRNLALVDQVNEANDIAIVNAWKQMDKAGDPPPFVQRAFDRENVRLLTETNDHFKDCGTWYSDECDCSVRFIGMEESYD